MLIRKYPTLVTVSIWLTCGVYGIYWAIHTAMWIRKMDDSPGIGNLHGLRINCRPEISVLEIL